MNIQSIEKKIQKSILKGNIKKLIKYISRLNTEIRQDILAKGLRKLYDLSVYRYYPKYDKSEKKIKKIRKSIDLYSLFLSCDNDEIQQLAFKVLSESLSKEYDYGQDKALKYIYDLTSHPDVRIQQHAIASLKKLAKFKLDYFVSSQLIIDVIRLIGPSGKEWAFEILSDKLKSNTYVKYALLQLTNYDKKRTVPLLIENMNTICGAGHDGELILELGNYKDRKLAETLQNRLKRGDELCKKNSDQIDYSYRYMWKEVRVLAEIGDKLTSEAVIDWIFEYYTYCGWEYFRDFNPYKLFGDYTDLIVRSSMIRYPTVNESLKATRKLCSIKSAISNNILIKISNQRDFKHSYYVDNYSPFTRTDNYILQEQRDLAINELIKRANPPYDPKVYQVEKEWILKE